METLDPHPRGWYRVLVIDDDPDIGRLIRTILELEGYEVVLSDDGSRGLAIAQRQRPDVIVLDLMMPVMDGFEALTHLRKDARTNDIPVLVLTAVALQDSRRRALEAGATMYLTKPFDGTQFSGAVAAAIADRGASSAG
ncbi:MAG TPA: response regulator [Candidatus Limnocylindrales bacterium]|nr:response regulator [Candidatus Limnocylindrales bacterium]